jgi:DNA-binding MarR family transcriptional regulator
VTREPDPRDGRRKRLQVTPLGFEVMRRGEAVFDELRSRWERQIGTAELASLEGRLAQLVGTVPIRFDTPGWIARDIDGSV